MVRLPIYVLDFDGVICDSTDECMVTSWNAWQRWSGGDGFREIPEAFDPLEAEKFRRARPLVRGAGEYLVVRQSIADDDPIVGQADYDERVRQATPHLEPFKVVFLKERRRLRDIDAAAWLDLHIAFPEVVNFARRTASQSRLYIATLKDRGSVKAILGRHGVNLLDYQILDEGDIVSKLQGLEMIAERESVTYSDLVFVDDNAVHLLEPHAVGFSVFQSTWGNVLSEGLKLGGECGVPTLGLDELKTLE